MTDRLSHKRTENQPSAGPNPLKEGAKLPQQTVENFSESLLLDPDNLDRRLEYAQFLRVRGHGEFAELVEQYIALQQRVGTFPLECSVPREQWEGIKTRFESLRERYFLPPAAGEGRSLSRWDNTLDGGLQRETHLVGHLHHGDFYLEHYKGTRAYPLCSDFTPFEVHRDTLQYQPFCAFTLYRGTREMDILGERGLLPYVGQIEIGPKDNFNHAELVKHVASVSRRLRHLILRDNREQHEVLSVLNSLSPVPLNSISIINSSHSGDLRDLLQPRLSTSLSHLYLSGFDATNLAQLFQGQNIFPSLKSLRIRCHPDAMEECRQLVQSNRKATPVLKELDFFPPFT